jgi:hypothetical protein
LLHSYFVTGSEAGSVWDATNKTAIRYDILTWLKKVDQFFKISFFSRRDQVVSCTASNDNIVVTIAGGWQPSTEKFLPTRLQHDFDHQRVTYFILSNKFFESF